MSSLLRVRLSASSLGRQSLKTLKVASTALVAVWVAQPVGARLTRLVVESQSSVAARPGQSVYRILRGHYDGELDPRDRHNRIITDIGRATMRGGRVPYSATFAIAIPEDHKRVSGIMVYDVPNRGRETIVPDFDGEIRVASGWQGDIDPQPGVQSLVAPTAFGAAGRPLTGPVLQQFTNVSTGMAGIAIAGGLDRPSARPAPQTTDTRRARLFYQASDQGIVTDLPPSDWAFADCRTVPFPGTPDPTRLCLRGGFDRAKAYTLIYQGKDPKVLGVGFAAVRDLNAFLRSGIADDAGNPNPVAGLVRWTIVTGTSQSGNFIRSFIDLGFNRSEDDHRVFDGANPNIAARLLPLNVRFGLPGGAAGTYEAGSEGNVWWSRYADRARGRGVSSLLDRCHATDTCPKIVETFGSAEFWGLRMSPDLVGTDAKADIPLPAEVRRYYFPGVTHGGSRTGGFPMKGEPPYPGAPRCTLAGNPNSSAETRRVALKALSAWVATGKAPPPSRYPTLAAGDLVSPSDAAMGWPRIPGPTPEGKINVLPNYDFGATFNYRDLSGVQTRQPPAIRGYIPMLVPRVNRDGNETAGIPSVQLLVPTGTYTGWNELAEGYGKGGGCGFVGGFIPFAKTEMERQRRGDPRPSLEARYKTHAGFVARIRSVAAEQVAAGWLLPDDAAKLIDQAEASDVLR